MKIVCRSCEARPVNLADPQILSVFYILFSTKFKNIQVTVWKPKFKQVKALKPKIEKSGPKQKKNSSYCMKTKIWQVKGLKPKTCQVTD